MQKHRYFIIYKPFGMLSQFSETPEGVPVLKELGNFPKDVYPVGRLDKDSEGLLILTNDVSLNNRLLNPKHGHEREYYVQVERIPDEAALEKLEKGVDIKGHFTAPAKARLLKQEPILPERHPPIRYRKNVPDAWISLTLFEGKNRQVRRMTAAVGHPTLRLVRYRIEGITIQDMKAGEVRELSNEKIMNSLFGKKKA